MPSLAEECCKLGIELMQKHDDPDVRKAAFGLFGAVVSCIISQNLFEILPNLVKLVQTCLKLSERVQIVQKRKNNPAYFIPDKPK